MSMIKMLLTALLLASPALAESPATKPRPEVLIVFSKDMRMGARLTDDYGAGLISELKKPVFMRLEAGFWTDGAATGKVILRCTARFVMADGTKGKTVVDKICYENALSKTANSWTLMKTDLRFRPVVTDPAGVMGVELTVRDMLSGTSKTLTPTFDWQGGTR